MVISRSAVLRTSGPTSGAFLQSGDRWPKKDQRWPLWLILRRQAPHASRPPHAAHPPPTAEHQICRIFGPGGPTPPDFQKGKARLNVLVVPGRAQRPAVQTRGASSRPDVHKRL